MSFAVGSLVKARGREWVVLPDSADDLLILRPLGGAEDEVTGLYLPLERVEPAQFDLPDPTKPGDYRSARLLRDAVRLGFRSSAGPFRSFARIAVEPRPYQFVPLLMALKLDPVRLLIADDVGIGKTIEAALIARELMDRGEVGRLAVLCPPHLAEQWQDELRDKFHLDAELVLPSTATRLERACRPGQSLFDVYPYVIVSMDFIKSEARRQEFQRTCPELVIVDEAHTCAWAGEGRGARHQRHQLIAGLARDGQRHLILVTATPHSGKEEAFRSLLGFLDDDFKDLPADLSGKANEKYRRRLATHFVQRRRGDIRHFMQADTPFPERQEREETYKLSADTRRLFDRVLAYAKETVTDPAGGDVRQRVRWWSALALLRSLASSPAAAAATLRTRAASADTEAVEDADEIGRRTVMDLVDDQSPESADTTPGADPDEGGEGGRQRRRLLEMAREAEALYGAKDAKLARGIELVKALLKDGYNPIVFCRFIPTAEYVADALRLALRGVAVEAVTGLLPPAEREERVAKLMESERRVLVATDCLSEGINLQEGFDAVLHYDLSWNPTRHEQREGRVDRFGQPSPTVRVVTYYGVDNQIDGIVLDVLLRKHKRIREDTGVAVPVPSNSEGVLEAIFEGLLLREGGSSHQLALPLLDQYLTPQTRALDDAWQEAADREKRSRSLFAQDALTGAALSEVERELHAVRDAIGSGVDVERFMRDTAQAHGGVVTANGATGPLSFDLRETPLALRDAVGEARFTARFALPVREGEVYLTRTHPIVEGLATHLLDASLDALGDGVARRCGVIRTGAVARRTTLLIARFRYHIVARRRGREEPLLAEDCRLLAFAGAPQSAEWLSDAEAESLLDAAPEGNVFPEQAVQFVERVVNNFDALRPHLDEVAEARGRDLLDAHQRVRQASRDRSVSYRVEPQLPPDVLGVYVYLPKA